MRTLARFLLPGAVAAILIAAPLVAWAGKPGAYKYGEAWWSEYQGDESTNLLLHFGKPQLSGHAKLAKALDTKKKDENLDLLLEGGDSSLPAGLDPTTVKQVVVNDDNLPPDEVQDYSPQKRRYKLTANAVIVPQGRFGAGLKLNGGAALVCKAATYQPTAAMECFFKVERLPEQVACVLSINKDEGRVLLRPDGRIELKLRKPHGIPNANEHSPERIKDILALPAEIVAPEPITPGQWVHVMAFNHVPSVQGGAPFVATLKVNGHDVAQYASEKSNGYNFMDAERRPFELTIGNNFDRTQGFAGLIDEVRISARERFIYRRPPVPWRDTEAKRTPAFGQPFFFRDGAVFHASLDRGLEFDFHKGGAKAIELSLLGMKPDGLRNEGIRGHAWSLNPDVGFPRLPLQGMSAQEGTIEFWVQPLNWDDGTSYWHHSPPPERFLSVARVYGKLPDGSRKLYMEVSLERAYNAERSRGPNEPGTWMHLALTWRKSDPLRAQLYRNGKWFTRAHRAKPEEVKGLVLDCIEMGASNAVTVAHDEKPMIAVDEVAGYSYALSEPELEQAFERWQEAPKPLSRFHIKPSYKWSIAKLECQVQSFPPDGISASRMRIGFHREGSADPLFPLVEAPLDENRGKALLSESQPVPPGKYLCKVAVLDQSSKVLMEGEEPFEIRLEAWRDSRAGLIEKVPPPWTPIEWNASEARTRMTVYKLGADGLPTQINAAGEDLLASPMRLIENDQPLTGTPLEALGSNAVEASWRTSFQGQTVDVELLAKLEYDGMLRFEWTLKPKGKVGRLRLELPMKAARATRYLYNVAGTEGMRTGVLDPKDGTLFSSRMPSYWQAAWQAKREKKPEIKLDEWKQYAFLTQWGVNDLQRGVYVFADHAAGWSQSKEVDAQRIVRRDGAVVLEMNFTAEPAEKLDPSPIVFGLLPHPARPMPERYRLYERATPAEDKKLCGIYGNVDAFTLLYKNPRNNGMAAFPAPDPEKPADKSPSWEYAERCAPHMKAERPNGYRTLYLSKYWFSCRAGAYDHWEWRNGPSGQATLSQSFVDYLCWEMNEWIGRDIYDAIYLDECYEAPSSNVEARQAILLPDGSVQPGETLWGFRQLMKRWRAIFHAHGKSPMIAGHHTKSWMYAGMVFCDTYLDGENTPIVSANSRDFVDQVALHRAEGIQNGALWGLAPFYMPAVWEMGFDNKEYNPHKRWAWRMARGVNSLLAHYETGYTYTGQGESVYRDYWRDVFRWGAALEQDATFHPYYSNAEFLKVDGQGSSALVSFYRKPGAILLLASNRAIDDREFRIKLNRDALGLKGKLQLELFDTGYKPAAGNDLESKASREAEVQEALAEGASLDGPPDVALQELDLLIKDTDSKNRVAEPRFEGEDMLILPVRKRDYRLVSIKSVP
ncbi:MAG: hypothetical protein HS116_28475 [Planctomycetes bacterium]|nr:hypothetical protein [Planctomycetota bacterium]